MAIELLAELRALGVVLSIDDGRLAYDGPADVLTDDLLARMRDERDGLLAALTASPEYLAPMPAVFCPWCQAGDFLLEHPQGLRCDQCGRNAWRLKGDAIERADWVELREVEWPV